MIGHQRSLAEFWKDREVSLTALTSLSERARLLDPEWLHSEIASWRLVEAAVLSAMPPFPTSVDSVEIRSDDHTPVNIIVCLSIGYCLAHQNLCYTGHAIFCGSRGKRRDRKECTVCLLWHSRLCAPTKLMRNVSGKLTEIRSIVCTRFGKINIQKCCQVMSLILWLPLATWTWVVSWTDVHFGFDLGAIDYRLGRTEGLRGTQSWIQEEQAKVI